MKKKTAIIWCIIFFLLGLAPGYIMTTVKIDSYKILVHKKQKEIDALEKRIDEFIKEIEELKK